MPGKITHVLANGTRIDTIAGYRITKDTNVHNRLLNIAFKEGSRDETHNRNVQTTE